MNVSIDSKSSGLAPNVPLARACEHLRDLRPLLELFPKLRRLEPAGEGVYFTQLNAIGMAGISHVVSYTSRYAVDVAKGTVEWGPAPGAGNAAIHGRCQLSAEGNGTRLELRAWGELRELDVPLLARPFVPQVIKPIFDGMIELYVERLVSRVKD